MANYRESGSAAQIAITAAQSLLVFLNIVGNSLVCVIIIKNQDMRISINYLLMNLAAADMTVGIFLAPQQIFFYTFTHPDGVTGTLLCRLLTGGNVAWVGAGASIFTLVAIATERYYAVMYPHRNKGKLDKRKLKVILLCSWIFGAVIAIPGFLVKKYDEEKNYCVRDYPEKWMGKAYSLAWFLLLAFLPVSFMVALYSRVVYVLWFKRAGPNECNYQHQGVMKVRKRVTLTVITVSFIFAVCWLTDSIKYLLAYNFPSHQFLTYAAGYVMLLSNSAINPMVYALVNRRFREKIKLMCCTSCRRNNAVHSSLELQTCTVVSTAHPILQETRQKYME